MAEDCDLENKSCNELTDTDDIPSYTEVLLTNNEIKKKIMNKYSSKRILRMFISHLLNDTLVQQHGLLERFFVVNNVTFRDIIIKGIVVAVDNRRPSNKMKLISVDDGTGTIDCYFRDVGENTYIQSLKDNVSEELDSLKDDICEQGNANNEILKATLMMLQNAKGKLNQVAAELNLGETIALVGTLSEYRGRRVCFISKLLKTDQFDNSRYLEEIYNLYQIYTFL